MGMGMGRGMARGTGAGWNVIQSQSGCRLLCILSRSTCMLPDASQDPTIRHILNDVSVAIAIAIAVSVNVPSRNYYAWSLGLPHVALIEKFASQGEEEEKGSESKERNGKRISLGI